MPEVSLQASPFADDFVDVAAVNAHVSTELVARIESVKRAAAAGTTIASKAIAVLGPAGGGKTHLFARLRHLPEARPTLVLMRPYFGVTVTIRDVLAVVVDQLCLPVHGGSQTQLASITAYWLRANEDLADPAASGARGDPVESAVGRIVALLPELAPAAYLARAILQLDERDPSARWGELAWLSGREPRGDAASDAPLPERDVLHMLRIVATLAAPIAPIVITFDQLENLAGDDEARVLGYGNLVSEIVDTLPSLTIVQLALTSEWMQFIEPRLSLPQKTRMARETFVLSPPDRAQRELLLRAWHARFVVTKTPGGRKRRFPSPLSEADLEVLLTAPGMTPRLLLASLARGIAGQPMLVAPSASAADTVEDGGGLWAVEHARMARDVEEKERSGLPFDAAEVAEGIASALSFVPGLEVTTRTERDRVLTSVKSPGHELTIVYLPSLHHVAVGSTLAKAAELAQSTKVVVVREARFELPRTWEAVHERRAAFERLPNARWLWLDRDEIERCLTLARLLSQARAKRLRHRESDEPLTIDRVRGELLRAVAPQEWASVTAIVRWLSDVPREPAAPVRARVPRSRPTPPAAAASVPPPPLEEEKAAFAPAPALRAWIKLGGKIGRAAVTHYVHKVRALSRR